MQVVCASRRGADREGVSKVGVRKLCAGSAMFFRRAPLRPLTGLGSSLTSSRCPRRECLPVGAGRQGLGESGGRRHSACSVAFVELAPPMRTLIRLLLLRKALGSGLLEPSCGCCTFLDFFGVLLVLRWMPSAVSQRFPSRTTRGGGAGLPSMSTF
jgi:hypothetical protein